MSSNKHNGMRKPRAQAGTRKPSLGYYLIFTDTKETENEYFKGLRDSLPHEIKDKLVIKVIPRIKTDNLVTACIEELNQQPQFRIPWLVFDRDEVKEFDSIIIEAINYDIKVGWSNPCFEVWLHSYFQIPPYTQDSVQCCTTFGTQFRTKTTQEYDKGDANIYQKLSTYGNEKLAIVRSEQLYKSKQETCQKPSQMIPCSTVFLLIDEIRSKCK